MKKIKTIFTLCIVLIISGCGTIIDNTGFVHIEPEHKIYGGTRLEYDALYGTGGYGFTQHLKENYFQTPYMALIDFPMCIVMDTVFLPYTVPYNISKEDKREEKNE